MLWTASYNTRYSEAGSCTSMLGEPSKRPRPLVEGWLLVLCFVLLVISPASILYSVWRVFPTLLVSHSLARILLLCVYCATFLSLALCSVWAGVKLLRAQPHADRFARMYLLGYLSVNIVYFLFWILITRPTQTLSFAEMGWYHVVGPIGSTALWYFYLENSTRVRRTYGRDL